MAQNYWKKCERFLNIFFFNFMEMSINYGHFQREKKYDELVTKNKLLQ